MEPDRKTLLLGHFMDISHNMFQAVSDYHLALSDASEYADSDPVHFARIRLSATTKLKLDVSGNLQGFERLFDRFMGSLNEGERESVRKIRFLLDELRKNQDAINAIYGAHHARLEWLRGHGGRKAPLGEDLTALSLTDAIIVAESFVMFTHSLMLFFAGECYQISDTMLKKHKRPESFDNMPISNAIREKAEKLEDLGIPVSSYTKGAFGESYDR